MAELVMIGALLGWVIGWTMREWIPDAWDIWLPTLLRRWRP